MLLHVRPGCRRKVFTCQGLDNCCPRVTAKSIAASMKMKFLLKVHIVHNRIYIYTTVYNMWQPINNVKPHTIRACKQACLNNRCTLGRNLYHSYVMQRPCPTGLYLLTCSLKASDALLAEGKQYAARTPSAAAKCP